MKRPEALNHVLEDLRAEGFSSTVGVKAHSKAVIHSGPEEEERVGIILDADECQLAFHSQDTVERFLDAFEADLGDASLELFDLNVDAELITLLESVFGSVEEL